MKIGDLTVDPVLDGQFLISREFVYPNKAPERWKRYEHLLDGGTHVVNQLGGYLVRGNDFVALVDLGFGSALVPGWEAGEFLDSLKALGVKPEDVTDVLFTHLHFDHIGWAAVGGDPVFANATHRCHARDWRHFTSPDHRDLVEMLGPGADRYPDEMLTPKKLGPIAHLVETWSEAASIMPGVDALEAPGHSPGTTAMKLSSNGESALLIGDIAHHQSELIEPDWPGIGDIDAVLAKKSRDAVAQELADTGMPFAAAHFRGFEWGRLVRDDSGLAWRAAAQAAST
jgi:glyoxylase-like metal-dependent hydrolase (beta-lactamase superfamily II)